MLSAEETLRWVHNHVKGILQRVTDMNDPEQFVVTWIDSDGFEHENRCRNLQELAARITEEEKNAKVSLEQRTDQG